MALPIKTTEEDIEVLANYLDNRVGLVPLAQLRSTVAARHGDNRKIEAMRFVGLLERNGEDVKLTDEGHAFARAREEKREEIVAARLRDAPLYAQTLEWMHFQQQLEPTKTQVAQFWHDKQGSRLEGAAGAALTDAAIFFMRLVGMSGLGKFIAAGTGRDTHVEMDPGRLATFVTGLSPGAVGDGESAATAAIPETPQHPQVQAAVSQSATVSGGVHVNIEIHVAADAKADTVREIFRNMRRYVLGLPDMDEKKS